MKKCLSTAEGTQEDGFKVLEDVRAIKASLASMSIRPLSTAARRLYRHQLEEKFQLYSTSSHRSNYMPLQIASYRKSWLTSRSRQV